MNVSAVQLAPVPHADRPRSDADAAALPEFVDALANAGAPRGSDADQRARDADQRARDADTAHRAGDADRRDADAAHRAADADRRDATHQSERGRDSDDPAPVDADHKPDRHDDGHGDGDNDGAATDSTKPKDRAEKAGHDKQDHDKSGDDDGKAVNSADAAPADQAPAEQLQPQLVDAVIQQLSPGADSASSGAATSAPAAQIGPVEVSLQANPSQSSQPAPQSKARAGADVGGDDTTAAAPSATPATDAPLQPAAPSDDTQTNDSSDAKQQGPAVAAQHLAPVDSPSSPAGDGAAVNATPADGASTTASAPPPPMPAAPPAHQPQAPPAQPDVPLPDSMALQNDANAGRVVRGLHAAMNQNGGSVTLRLQPPELGFVRVQLDMAEGVVRAQFTAQHESVRSMLQHQMSQLRSALESQGLSVDRLDVHVSQPTSSGTAHQQGHEDLGHSSEDGRSRGEYAGSRDGGGRGRRDSGGDTAQRQPDFNRELLNTVA